MGKPKGPAPVAPCRLRGEVTTLRWSHIVPRWVYVRISETGEPGRRVPVQVRNGVAMIKSDQLADYLLCGDCEDLLHHWETYVSQISRNGDEFPALTTALKNLLPSRFASERMRLADVSSLNVDAITRFAVSVIWRAAACPALFPALHLGSTFDRFGAFLLGKDQFPSEAHLVLSLIDNPDVPQLSRLAAPPSSGKHDGGDMHAFMLFGLAFEFFIGCRSTSAFDHGCLHRTGRAIVTNGHRQIHGVAHEARRSVAKGVLATRRGLKK